VNNILFRFCYLENVSSLFPGAVDVICDRLSLFFADDGAHVDHLVQAVTDPEVRQSSLQFRNKLFENRFLEKPHLPITTIKLKNIILDFLNETLTVTILQ
jgi:hypothetical protein